MKKLWAIFGVLAALVLIATCAGVASSVLSGDDPPPMTITYPTDSPSPRPQASRSPWVDDGDWLVGKDIKAGTYVSPGATDGFCAWVVRASDDQNAEVVSVGSADKENQPQRAVVKKGQVFQTTGCRGWVRQ